MLDRMCAGEVPAKHHIAFRNPDTGKLYMEECLTRKGFDGPYTIVYHAHRPHEQHVLDEVPWGWTLPTEAQDTSLRRHHFKSQDMAPTGGPSVNARRPILFNEDIVLSVLHPSEEDPVYFANNDGDDLFFIFKGSGTIRTILGDLRYAQDDYVFIPKGVMYRCIPDEGVEQYWLSLECLDDGLHLPSQWRNDVGQLRMDAPYCHRDFTRPTFRGPLDEGIRTLLVKRLGAFHGFSYDVSPLDVVGWDGTVYPWVFPILNFQPRAGLVHLPPTWHGTFAARRSLICSFVPRAVDFHPEAIPCPYAHASVDCDEFLFYVRGNFTSRRGVGPGSISYHPMGWQHGPHPGADDASIGHRETSELAVMVDTFRPLYRTQEADQIADADYQESFFE